MTSPEDGPFKFDLTDEQISEIQRRMQTPLEEYIPWEEVKERLNKRIRELSEMPKTDRPLDLLVGCGTTRREGFLGTDIIDGPSVDICAPAWNIPLEDGTVSHIVAEHLIEHLTYYEFQRTMEEWRRLLKSGGILEIECPDLEEVCKQFGSGNEYERYASNTGTWPLIAQLYGHQRGHTPDEQLSQVHKSGYTYEHLHTVLEGLRYTNITKETPKKLSSGPCIRLKAIKS